MPERVTPDEMVTTEEALELLAVPDIVAETSVVTELAVAVKLTPLHPSRVVTDDGTFRAVLEEVSLIVVVPLGPADSLATQLVDPPDATVAGVHVILASVGSVEADEMETAATLLMPLHVAVTSTDVVAETTPAVELKLAEVAPAGMIKLAGTGSIGEEEVSVTVAFDVAARVSATAQLALAPDASDEGLHVTVESAGGAAFVEIETNEVLLTPPQVAVTFAEVVAETVPAVELKLVDVDPAGIMILAGTGSDAEDEVRVTVALVVGALVKVTEQLVLEPDAIDEGVQLIAESAGELPPATFTAAPELVSGIASPAADVPIALFMPMPMAAPFERLEASVTVTLATSPLGIEVAFIP